MKQSVQHTVAPPFHENHATPLLAQVHYVILLLSFLPLAISLLGSVQLEVKSYRKSSSGKNHSLVARTSSVPAPDFVDSRMSLTSRLHYVRIALIFFQ